MQSKFSIALFLYSKNKSYGKLLNLALHVSGGLAKMSSVYVNPFPSRLAFDGQVQRLKETIARWGSRSNHGTTADKANLKEAAEAVRISLTQLSQWVMFNDPNNPTNWQNAGFTVKSGKTPVGPLQAVRNLHQVISPRVPTYFTRIKWTRPLDSERARRIKYKVLRSSTPDFSTAVLIATVSKTVYEYRPPSVNGDYHWIIPINNDGSDAVVSDYCFAIPIKA